ncbi:MAG: Asp-tRNA(Asn)/Glu-tRNA(Gln) amidotransferase subunit GatC [Candidatus Falkowbacteria bacterium]|nr:Asp-tRNA(Asn)/Glu-tRNA(Gln) amidotransferase subunit GatC [Candidatus Falkowbacteria bacterium]
MKLSKDQVKNIANLARLSLTKKELDLYSEQLSDILTYINQLQEVDTTGLEPTAQVTGLADVMRVDEVNSWPDREVKAALEQAPEKEGRQVKVKKILP